MICFRQEINIRDYAVSGPLTTLAGVSPAALDRVSGGAADICRPVHALDIQPDEAKALGLPDERFVENQVRPATALAGAAGPGSETSLARRPVEHQCTGGADRAALPPRWSRGECRCAGRAAAHRRLRAERPLGAAAVLGLVAGTRLMEFGNASWIQLLGVACLIMCAVSSLGQAPPLAGRVLAGEGVELGAIGR